MAKEVGAMEKLRKKQGLLPTSALDTSSDSGIGAMEKLAQNKYEYSAQIRKNSGNMSIPQSYTRADAAWDYEVAHRRTAETAREKYDRYLAQARSAVVEGSAAERAARREVKKNPEYLTEKERQNALDKLRKQGTAQWNEAVAGLRELGLTDQQIKGSVNAKGKLAQNSAWEYAKENNPNLMTDEELTKFVADYQAQQAEYQRLLGIDIAAMDADIEKAEAAARASHVQRAANARTGRPTGKDLSTTDADRKLAAMKADRNKAASAQKNDEMERLVADNQAFFDLVDSRMKNAPKQASEQIAYDRETQRILREAGYSVEDEHNLLEARKWVKENQKYDEAYEKAREFASYHPVIASAASVPTNLVGGITGEVGLIGQKVEGRDVMNVKGPGMGGYAYTQGARNTVSANLAKTHDGEILGQNVASFLYDTGMSMADSSVIMAMSMVGVPAGAGTALLGASSAVDATVRAKAAGADDNHAIATGLAAGAAEYVFEKVSLEHLLSLGSAGKGAGIKKIVLTELKNMGTQAFTEGSEEFFTELANAISDAVINGEMSDYNRSVSAYMEQGMTQEDARKQATKDFLTQLAVSFAGGAASGGLFGSVGSAVNVRGTVQADTIAKEHYGADSAALVEEALDINPDNKTAQRAQKRLEQGKALSGDTMRVLAEQNQEFIERQTAQEAEGSEQLVGNTDTLAGAAQAAEMEVTNVQSGSESKERSDGLDGQLEAPGLAQVTAVSQAERNRAAESIRAAVANEGIAESEALKLGIKEARPGSTVRVVPENLYTQEMQDAARQNAANGVKTVFVVGAIKLSDGGTVRGVVDGDTIWIRADHADFSPTELNNHENFHRASIRDPGLISRTLERIVERYGDEDLANMVLAYADAYEGTGMTSDEILAEICADAYAGMNALGFETGTGDASRYTEEAVTEMVNSHQTQSALSSGEESTRQEYSRDIERDMHRENEALRRSIAEMRERKEYFKAQSQQTRTSVSPAIIKRMEAQYIQGTSLESGDIRQALTELGDWMHGSSKKADFYAESKRRAMDIAQTIVQNATEIVNPEQVEDLRRLKKTLREHPLSVSDAVKADFDDWSAWRAGNRAVVIRSDGTPVDVRYEELREQFGEYAFPRDITNPADQLRQIARAVEMLGPKFENPNSYYMSAATEIMANQILRDMVHPTKTDKLLAEAKRKARESRTKAVARVRAQKNERIAALLKKQQEADAKRRETAQVSETTRKIRNLREDIAKAMKSPTENKYIPSELMGSCLRLLEMLDTTSGRQNATNAKFWAELERLRRQYADLQHSEDPDFASEYDPDFAYMVDQLGRRLQGRAVRDLTPTEVEDVYQVLRDIHYMVRDARFQIGKAERITNYSVGESIARQQAARKDIMTKGREAFDRSMRISASPLRNVRRMADYSDDAAIAKLFADLNDGVRKKNLFIMHANKLFDKFAGERMRKSATEKKKYTFRDEDGHDVTVEMTEMQAMTTILSFEREAADTTTLHLQSGGIKILDTAQRTETMKQYKAAKYSHIGAEEIAVLTASMDDWANEYMDAARSFFNGMAKDAINETTMQTRHRKAATIRNYIPFEVDKDTTARDVEGLKFDASPEAVGFLKSVQAGASNALTIRNLNEVIQRHIESTAQYYGLAIPIRNYNKAMAVTPLGGRETVRSYLHPDDAKFLDQVVSDLLSSRHREKNALTDIMDKLQSTFVKSTLLSNVSVTIKQAASYATAGRYLSQAALAPYQGTIAKLFANSDSAFARALFAEIDAHTAQHYMRRKGMSLQEAATIANDDSRLSRWMDKHVKNDALNPLKWIQGMDVATTAALWLACKKQVELDGTKADSAGYWDAVTALYNRVIEETQPMYDPIHRPEVQRSTNELLRAILMFRTQPLQNAGIIWDAVGALEAAKRTGKGVNEARRSLSAAILSQVASAAVFSTMTMLAYALRNRMGRYRDDEEELTVWSVMKTILGDMLQTGAGLLLPIGGTEAYSLVSGLIQKATTGKAGYDVISVPVVDMVNDWVTDINKLCGHLAADEKDFGDIGADLRIIAMDAAAILGIPAENVFNIIRGIVGNVTDIAGVPVDWATDITNTYAAMNNAWDRGHYAVAKKKLDAIIADKVRAGKTEKEARSAAKSSVTSRFKPDYIAAARKKDTAEMNRIKRLLKATGLYDDLDKTLKGWLDG